MQALRSRPLAVALPRRPASAWIAPLVWAAIIVAGHLIGGVLYDRDPLVRVGAPPVVGSYDLRIGAALLPALALAAAALAWAPGLARRLRWNGLLAGAWAGAGAWAAALASSDGLDAIAAPLSTRYEYLAAVPAVVEPGRFIDGFITALPGYPTHVKGHPPGMVTVLWLLEQVGLGGAEVAAALVIAAGALVAPAALIALRATASEAAARRAAPYLVFAPAAVWVATSADALFAGVAATGIACFALAATRPRDARPAAIGIGLLSGLVLGAALMLSYGVAALGAIVLVLAVARRAWLPLAAAGAGVLLVLGAFAALGFVWFEGLRATGELYGGGVASRRPHAAFIVINLAAFGLALGPAAAAGLGRLRERGVWLLAGPMVAAIAIVSLSGLSKGEVERIWLPFVPWILVATAALRPGRGWLAAQLALALALQAGVRSPW
ncbi:MAG: hypothetical protein ACR2LK_00490 [Solirubrobacteraceae bacterium]